MRSFGKALFFGSLLASLSGAFRHVFNLGLPALKISSDPVTTYRGGRVPLRSVGRSGRATSHRRSLAVHRRARTATLRRRRRRIRRAA